MSSDQVPADREHTVLGRTVRNPIGHVEVFRAPDQVTIVHTAQPHRATVAVTQRPRGGIEVQASAERRRP